MNKIGIVRKRQRGAVWGVFIDRRELGALGGEGWGGSGSPRENGWEEFRTCDNGQILRRVTGVY